MSIFKTIFALLLATSFLPGCSGAAQQLAESSNGFIRVTDRSRGLWRYENQPRYLYNHAQSMGGTCRGFTDPRTGRIMRACAGVRSR